MSPDDEASSATSSIGDATRMQLANLLALHARHTTTLATLTQEQQAAAAQIALAKQQTLEALAQRQAAQRKEADNALNRQTSVVQQARRQVNEGQSALREAAAAAKDRPAAPSATSPALGDYSDSLTQHMWTFTRSAGSARSLAAQVENEAKRLAKRRRNAIIATGMVAIGAIAAALWGVQQRSQRLHAVATATAQTVAAQAAATAQTAAIQATATAQWVIMRATATAQTALRATATAQAVAFVADAPSAVVAQIEDGSMRPVPAGPFQMGCSPGDTQCDADEYPLHEVLLDAYAIDTYEVTTAQYALCVDAGVCTPPAKIDSLVSYYYYGFDDHADYPVVNISVSQARGYCRWKDKRLPTEAEWEKAARGGHDTRIYPWGDETPNCSRLAFKVDDRYCIYDQTSVGSFPDGRSPYGVMDMSGNVWEWVSDWKQDDYYQDSPNSNPTGPASGSQQVIRGGAWDTEGVAVRASNRGSIDRNSYRGNIGFRCVQQ